MKEPELYITITQNDVNILKSALYKETKINGAVEDELSVLRKLYSLEKLLSQSSDKSIHIETTFSWNKTVQIPKY